MLESIGSLEFLVLLLLPMMQILIPMLQVRSICIFSLFQFCPDKFELAFEGCFFVTVSPERLFYFGTELPPRPLLERLARELRRRLVSQL